MAGFPARVMFEGGASGEVLWLSAPLSFWGGFNPATGVIIDNNHPQKGKCIKNTMLVMPATRGSGGTPGGVAEAVRNGSGPAAIIMGICDANVVTGAAVAQKLYGLTCPVLEVGAEVYEQLHTVKWLNLSTQGSLTAGRS